MRGRGAGMMLFSIAGFYSGISEYQWIPMA
jgi:hypothetical protein